MRCVDGDRGLLVCVHLSPLSFPFPRQRASAMPCHTGSDAAAKKKPPFLLGVRLSASMPAGFLPVSLSLSTLLIPRV